MPQMAPISWLLLFFIFSITFILFNVMNYYSYLPSTPKSSQPTYLSTNPFNWKW
uniref:ATP synthase F0 subunit 8 n=1 Tax=Tabanus pleskei TaxID=632608 RepID=UPI002237DCC7|nr:ATP synthase F0 subunit 8 [Tabanus pleskei]UYG48379.1 ATP synthase F0 subunit 8 [Tabanus pleskei]